MAVVVDGGSGRQCATAVPQSVVSCQSAVGGQRSASWGSAVVGWRSYIIDR